MRFTDDTFDADLGPTIGVDFKAKMVNVAGNNTKLTIWDTAGQERYPSFVRSDQTPLTSCLSGPPSALMWPPLCRSLTPRVLILPCILVTLSRFRGLTASYYRGAHGVILGRRRETRGTSHISGQAPSRSSVCSPTNVPACARSLRCWAQGHV